MDRSEPHDLSAIIPTQHLIAGADPVRTRPMPRLPSEEETGEDVDRERREHGAARSEREAEAKTWHRADALREAKLATGSRVHVREERLRSVWQAWAGGQQSEDCGSCVGFGHPCYQHAESRGEWGTETGALRRLRNVNLRRSNVTENVRPNDTVALPSQIERKSPVNWNLIALLATLIALVAFYSRSRGLAERSASHAFERGRQRSLVRSS